MCLYIKGAQRNRQLSQTAFYGTINAFMNKRSAGASVLQGQTPQSSALRCCPWLQWHREVSRVAPSPPLSYSSAALISVGQFLQAKSPGPSTVSCPWPSFSWVKTESISPFHFWKILTHHWAFSTALPYGSHLWTLLLGPNLGPRSTWFSGAPVCSNCAPFSCKSPGRSRVPSILQELCTWRMEWMNGFLPIDHSSGHAALHSSPDSPELSPCLSSACLISWPLPPIPCASA